MTRVRQPLLLCECQSAPDKPWGKQFCTANYGVVGLFTAAAIHSKLQT
jgi:hypothetical protein